MVMEFPLLSTCTALLIYVWIHYFSYSSHILLHWWGRHVSFQHCYSYFTNLVYSRDECPSIYTTLLIFHPPDLFPWWWSANPCPLLIILHPPFQQYYIHLFCYPGNGVLKYISTTPHFTHTSIYSASLLMGCLSIFTIPHTVRDMTASHLQVDWGSMHVVQYCMIYSPERNISSTQGFAVLALCLTTIHKNL